MSTTKLVTQQNEILNFFRFRGKFWDKTNGIHNK